MELTITPLTNTQGYIDDLKARIISLSIAAMTRVFPRVMISLVRGPGGLCPPCPGDLTLSRARARHQAEDTGWASGVCTVCRCHH